jgi:hypothetical protein
MNHRQLLKIEAKIQRNLERDHKKKWQQVRKKIRRLKLKRKDKQLLIEDSKHCNGDLMNVLYHSPQFTSLDDYFDTINAYLRSENDCYDYNGVTLAYMPTKMKELMQVITNQHRIIDLKAKLRENIMGNEPT